MPSRSNPSLPTGNATYTSSAPAEVVTCGGEDFSPQTTMNISTINTRMIAMLIALLSVTTCAWSQTVVPPQYFGMHYVKGQPWPTIPFGSLRLWDTDTRWQQMNPASGVYDFSTLDAYLALAHAHGLSDVVLVLGGTPNWISSDPFNAVCDYASTATGSCAPPSDLNTDGTGSDQAWRSFIYQLASHVAGLNKRIYSPVTSYEMWNEFSRSAESWTGSQAQMMRMAQDAYCILKGSGTIAATGENCAAQTFHTAVGISPRAVVVSPSAQASGPDVAVLGEYLSQFGATFNSPGPSASSAADVIATHNYTYGKNCCALPEGLIAQWSALQAVLPSSFCRTSGVEHGRKLGRHRHQRARPGHAVRLRRARLSPWLVTRLQTHVLVRVGQFVGAFVEPEWSQRLQRPGIRGGVHQSSRASLRRGLLMDGRQRNDKTLHRCRIGLFL